MQKFSTITYPFYPISSVLYFYKSNLIRLNKKNHFDKMTFHRQFYLPNVRENLIIKCYIYLYKNNTYIFCVNFVC